MPTPGTHVLLVEDSLLVTEAMRVLFEETGHRFRAAATVAEAIRAGLAERPDVMLLDLSLADGDGLEVLAALAARDAAPAATVALTGRDEPEVVRRCLDAGCCAVLVKPIQPRELLRRVAEVMRDAGMEG